MSSLGRKKGSGIVEPWGAAGITTEYALLLENGEVIIVKRLDQDPRLVGIADLGCVIPAVVRGNRMDAILKRRFQHEMTIGDCACC